MSRTLIGLLAFALGGLVAGQGTAGAKKGGAEEQPLRLGKFSVSLTVKDLAASRAFYEKLGFRAGHGEPEKNWVVLTHETTTIGLFQRMFPKNMLTFVPGWDDANQELADFDDVRDIQRRLTSAGLKLTKEADESATGPDSLMLVDPDGNPILLDQYVSAPKT